MRLTTWEREFLRLTVGQLEGLNVHTFRLCLDLSDKLELTEEEKKAANYIVTDDGAKWQDRGQDIEIELEDEETNLITDLVRQSIATAARNEALSVPEGKKLMALCEKLSLDFWQLIETDA